MKKNIPKIGKQLKKLRVELELTASEFSKQVGASKSYISACEIGRTTLSPKVLLKIIKRFNLDQVDAHLLTTACIDHAVEKIEERYNQVLVKFMKQAGL